MKREQLHTPVLLLIFNRPEETMRVFNEIRIVAPAKLYIASDGGRNADESERIAQLQEQLEKAIDWPCSLKTLYRTTNLGCRAAVSKAIDWFFENEELGIILEDDCLPHPLFFKYCDFHLKENASNWKIASIAGTRMLSSQSPPNGSGQLSPFFACWGWASWRAAWQRLRQAEEHKCSTKKAVIAPNLIHYYKKLQKICSHSQQSSWAYEIGLASLEAGLQHIEPPVNLIINLGFSRDSTHTARRPAAAPFKFGEISETTLKRPLEVQDPKDIAEFAKTQFQPLHWRLWNRFRYMKYTL